MFDCVTAQLFMYNYSAFQNLLIYMFMRFLISACDFQCDAGNACISKLHVCDGFYHCSDGQEEKNCGKQNKICYRQLCKIEEIFKYKLEYTII